ncbi:MAG: ROK family protein [Oscillospiraceae bacterium]|jgi:predicted NBD/HSP70 family sugar kinase|nr:ROK family protein [Oscillospiraceae bacterium]
MESSPASLAIDLGGTKLLIGEVDAAGHVLTQARYDSPLTDDADQRKILEIIVNAAKKYIKNTARFRPSAIGMGLVGRVDRLNGLWLEIDPNRCVTIPAAQILSNELQLRCAIDNDVRCALRAEQELGWGQKTSNYIYINIGTGIAAAFVTGGHVITGASWNAGEIGHTVVDIHSNVRCPCGRRGCVEAIASGIGLDRRARAMVHLYPNTALTVLTDERCSAADIFRLAKQGDELCGVLARDAADAIAALIMNLAWTCDPDTIVLGGGVVSDGWMFDQIRRRLLPGSMRFVKNGICLTGLDAEYVGLIGAGLTGFTAPPAIQTHKEAV